MKVFSLNFCIFKKQMFEKKIFRQFFRQLRICGDSEKGMQLRAF